MPHMRWHPETGENKIFGDGEAAPEGWLDYHPADADKAPPPVADEPEPATSADKPMTKKELAEALKEGGIEFDGSAKVADLDHMLSEALKGALTKANVEFAPDASTRALLALVRNQ